MSRTAVTRRYQTGARLLRMKARTPAVRGYTYRPLSDGGSKMSTAEAKSRRAAGLKTPTNLGVEATRDISGALNLLLADLFALYLKTKNFHWHVSGPHFRDYHLLFDEQAAEIFASIDDLAERVRKLGARTVHSVGEIAKLQTIKDNDKDFVTPADMLVELMNDNKHVIKLMRLAHDIADKHED